MKKYKLAKILPEKVLRQFAKIEFNDPSDNGIKKAAEYYYISKGMNPSDIVRKIFQVTKIRISVSSFRYWLSKLKVKLRSEEDRKNIITKSCESLGYSSVLDYFDKNQTKSYTDMSDELNVSISTVQRSYREYIKTYETRNFK